MNGRDRVEAVLKRIQPDRPPAGAWGHTYREEWSAVDLAAVTVERARRFGWDFVKFQPRASIFAEAFGSVYTPANHKWRAPTMDTHAVQSIADWSDLPAADGTGGVLAEQVRSIGIVARELGPAVPVIQTIFSPITVAGYLVGRNKRKALRDLREHPEIVQPALERIADGLADFAYRSVEAGAAGVFYAVSGFASRDLIRDPADYERLLLPLDLRVLERLHPKGWFNVLHLCGSSLHFELSRLFPLPIVGWSIHNKGNPSLAEGARISGKAVMGGLSMHGPLVYGSPEQVESEAREALREADGLPLILAPGCSIAPRARDANLQAMMTAVAG